MAQSVAKASDTVGEPGWFNRCAIRRNASASFVPPVMMSSRGASGSGDVSAITTHWSGAGRSKM